jgi:hypothetical protein
MDPVANARHAAQMRATLRKCAPCCGKCTPNCGKCAKCCGKCTPTCGNCMPRSVWMVASVYYPKFHTRTVRKGDPSRPKCQRKPWHLHTPQTPNKPAAPPSLCHSFLIPSRKSCTHNTSPVLHTQHLNTNAADFDCGHNGKPSSPSVPPRTETCTTETSSQRYDAVPMHRCSGSGRSS